MSAFGEQVDYRRALLFCQDYLAAEQYEDAKRCYSALLTHFGSSTATARNMLRLAQADYNQGLDMEALARFSEVANMFPNTWVAEEAERGVENALYRLGQREDSAEVLSELVDRYPTSAFAADAQFEIATRHYEAEQYQEAADAFRRVVSQFPGYGSADRAQYLMADAYARLGATAEARRGYEQFLVFFPESDLRTTVQFRLGLQLFEEKDYMGAAVKFTAVVEQGDDAELRPAALFNLATAQQLLGDVHRELDGYGERQAHVATGTTVNLRVHTNHFAIQVKQGAT